MSKNSSLLSGQIDDIIERFGGIRPMAKKIEVAPTTVQGWKKRGQIPADRLDKILEAANDHDIDLSDLMAGTSSAYDVSVDDALVAETLAPENDIDIDDDVSAHTSENNNDNDYAGTPRKESKKEKLTKKPESFSSAKISSAPVSESTWEKLENQLIKTEKKAVTKSLWLTVLLILLSLAFMAFVFFPSQSPRTQVLDNTRRIDVLEKNVEAVRKDVEVVQSRQSFFSTIIPEDLDKRIENIQAQAEHAREGIDSALKKVESISGDVLSENAGSLEHRLQKLEGHLQGMNASPELLSVLDRVRVMAATMNGRRQLDQSVGILNSTLDMVIDDGGNAQVNAAQVNAAIDNARTQNETLGKVFEGVSHEDMKAAALLLGMTQFRQSLNRQAPFADDMALLKKLIGQDNSELDSALNRLSPYAEKGVVSMPALVDSFKQVAGQAVVESLNGRDVSMQQKIAHAVSDFLKIEKNGQSLGATETEKKIANAKVLMEQGDIAGAITVLETLTGEAAVVVKPWLEQAKVSMQAGQVDRIVEQAIQGLSIQDFDAETSPALQDEAQSAEISAEQ